MKTGRILRCIRGQWLYLPTFDGELSGDTPQSQPTLFWARCMQHETRYRKTGKVTVAAVLRRFMASIVEKTFADGGWRTGVEGLRRYYRTKAPPHFQCDVPQRTAYNAVGVLLRCGMIECVGDELRYTREFFDGGLSITPERLAAVPVCLLVPCCPESGDVCIDGTQRVESDLALGLNPRTATKRARARAMTRERVRRFRANCTSQRYGNADACKESGVGNADACNPVTLSRATSRVVSGETLVVPGKPPGSTGDFQSPVGDGGDGGPTPSPPSPASLPPTPDPPGSANPPDAWAILTRDDPDEPDWPDPDVESGQVWTPQGYEIKIDKESGLG